MGLKPIEGNSGGSIILGVAEHVCSCKSGKTWESCCFVARHLCWELYRLLIVIRGKLIEDLTCVRIQGYNFV